MAASKESKDSKASEGGGGDARKKRYVRSGRHRAITPLKVPLLRYVAECGMLTTFQIIAMSGYTAKSARNHLLDLFHAGLLDKVAVDRSALAGLNAPNDSTLLFGSAPDIYLPTRMGLKLLHEAGLIDQATRDRTLPDYGPKNALFLAHELQVRDVRVWLERLTRDYTSHALETWRHGTEAHLYPARPDAWFVYRTGGVSPASGEPIRLVGLVEIDRGTERGTVRWEEKLADYAALMSGSGLKEQTGYQRALVLVLTPNEARTARIREMVASSPIASRFRITEATTLISADLGAASWVDPGKSERVPLVPPSLI